MADFYINSTSLARSYNYSNITADDQEDFSLIDNIIFISWVLTWIIICIGLPLTLVAICVIFSLVRRNDAAPIYVINLLISDLIQILCFIYRVAPARKASAFAAFYIPYITGLTASVGFMVCVALERYLIIAFPLWYRYRRTFKTSVLVCVVVWSFPVVFLLIFYFWLDVVFIQMIISILLLLPFPLLIFFLYGTLKALSASRVPSDEKRRIVGTLVLVLLTYTVLFLPYIISQSVAAMNYNFKFICAMLRWLSPLADLVLYVFMRKGTIDKLLASVRCCRMDSRMDSNDTCTRTSTV